MFYDVLFWIICILLLLCLLLLNLFLFMYLPVLANITWKHYFQEWWEGMRFQLDLVMGKKYEKEVNIIDGERACSYREKRK